MNNIENKILSLYHEITPNKSKEEITKLIQKIGEYLLNSIICFDNDEELKPLFVEAYFKDLNNQIPYKDSFIHKDKDEQRGDKSSPFHFYLHHNKCPTRKGVDIVIGDNPNIKLSYLIKVSRYNKETLLQSDTGNIFFMKFENDEDPNKLTRNLKVTLKEDPISRINYSSRILPSKKEKEEGYYNEVAIFSSGLLSLKEPPYEVVNSIKPLTIYHRFKG